MPSNRKRPKNSPPPILKKKKSPSPPPAKPKINTSPPVSPPPVENHSPTRSRSNSVTSTRSFSSLSAHSIITPAPIPPIFLSGASWKKVASKLLSSLPTNSLQAKVHDSNSVKLLCFEQDYFRLVQKYLLSTNTEFFTHPTSSERTLKVVIKGLLADTSDSELESYLKEKGYDVLNVRQFGNSTKKYPIHTVTLVSNPINKLIFRETNILYMSVKIESYRSNKPAQCFSC
jgi:hypothetical protein